MILCPFCELDQSIPFFEDKHRSYLQCSACKLVYVPPAFFLTEEQEKFRYDLHTNDPQDLAYRRFLKRLFEPLEQRINRGSWGLDFGSGPGPTLSVMFEEKGHHMDLYDYFYANDVRVWEKSYDFITATEVVEHLYNPCKELERLWALLKPGGYLGMMTKLVLNAKAFETWHYKGDRTHVCFFSKQTLEFLGAQWGATLDCIADDAFIFQKGEEDN